MYNNHYETKLKTDELKKTLYNKQKMLKLYDYLSRFIFKIY